MKRAPVTAQDVADYAGVSRTAVSRAFTPGASVSAETRAKVQRAAEALGYQVNHLARGLIRSESGLVALIAAEIETPYRSALLSQLAQGLLAAGKTPILIATDRSDDSVRQALQHAISYRTEAAVILSGMPDSALCDICLRNGMRLVLVNRDEARKGTLQIRLDDHEAGVTAFNTLRRAGCAALALVSSAAGTPSLAGRIAGFRHAAEAAGVTIQERSTGATSYQTGLEIGTDLLSSTTPPDGIFCVTDLLACGVLDAARCRFGLGVPADLSVIGFDDIAQAGWESYALNTFAQPTGEIAATAIDWLSDPDGETRVVQLPVRMVWRKSVRVPA
ncbi:LacI family DNA-binding transcriptional regulator [Acidimangrovimonas sediminis]|uniref:LacI family DNA-binding transcriptional regulator n=1 Tax=Acidimangrovimonas sediminis TaxID=2056283 RepID=UPI000C7FA38B|nr:LacI family DNA-binding transcriptional regulator [Acidimangrovimonas sediminis]